MTLLFIILGVWLAILILTAVFSDDWDRGDNLAITFMGGLLVIVIGSLISQGILSAVNHTSEVRTYDQHLVSLNDGTGISGHFSGGLFVMRGSIEDTQNFSFYRQEGAGYKLDKRPAGQSTIFTDTSADKAYVKITDTKEGCGDTWYQYLCMVSTSEWQFSSAEFHVPEGSITNDYVLGAK